MDLEARIKLLKHLEKNFTGFVKHQNAFNNDTEEIIRQLLYNTTQLDTHLVKTKDRLDEVERQQKDIKQKLFKLETEGAIYSYTWQRNEGRLASAPIALRAAAETAGVFGFALLEGEGHRLGMHS